ncbi:MAG: ATP-grasp domain-containing protein [Acidobacteriota bacterium]
MRTVAFVAPFAFETTLRFVDAAADVPNVRLVLISQDPPAKFPEPLRRKLSAHLQVTHAIDSMVILEAVREIEAKAGPVHRLLGTLEQLQVPLAAVREKMGIEGMGVEAAQNFRDKARMKDALRAADVPCARHRLIGTEDDAWSFADETGYPIVVKPPDGAGAKATFSVDGGEALAKVLRDVPPHPKRPLLAEEFIQGSEHSFDGVSLGGEVVWHSLTDYLPTPLDVVRNPWIQWCVLLPREIDDPKYDDVRSAAKASLDALGMDTGVCHLEWFRRGDGSIAISEVGARPGGAQISKLISYAHNFSFYRAWAGVEIDGRFDPPERAFAAGAAFLRGQGKGKIKRIHGLGRAQQEIGHLVVESNLPKLGQVPSSSYEGDGFAILRHPDTDEVRRALYRLISLVRVELG